MVLCASMTLLPRMHRGGFIASTRNNSLDKDKPPAGLTMDDFSWLHLHLHWSECPAGALFAYVTVFPVPLTAVVGRKDLPVSGLVFSFSNVTMQLCNNVT